MEWLRNNVIENQVTASQSENVIDLVVSVIENYSCKALPQIFYRSMKKSILYYCIQ